MNNHDYVELHLHTAFSFLDGASTPDELVTRAVDLGYTALAATDHDGLYGAMEFAQSAQAAGIAPITGAELTLTDGSHLTLLAETREGYANLCRLITEAHRLATPPADEDDDAPAPPGIPFHLRGVGKPRPRARDEKRDPALDPAFLARHAEGLILLTGCRKGRVSQLIDAGELAAAEAQTRQYVEWFGAESVVVELQHNLVHGDTQRIRQMVELANHLGLAYAATGNVHYHDRSRHQLQDVLVAIRNRTTLDGCHRERRPNAQFALRSAKQVARLFNRYPAAITATHAIAERCSGFNLARNVAYRFPDYPTAPGETADELLAQVCREALVKRYDENRLSAIARLEEELAVITKHGLAGFFLLYRDLLVLAREIANEVRGTDSARAAGNLPPGRGRGSSVSSIVCYLIGLSHVDPLAHDLFFGRFLNDEMASVPDIDLDFPREIREKLIARVYEVYGQDRAALVCAFSTYQLRSAVRDVGKALGLPQADLDKIAKLSERHHGAARLREELEKLPDYAARLDGPPWSQLIDLAGQLANFPRHVTQHVGGMIVSSEPLTNLVPIQPAAMEGRYLCHWDKDSCDDARMVKIDFLALGMLSLVEEALELIATSGKGTVDLSRIDFDDPAIYDMICAGDTVGTFQIESRAQIQMLPRTRPRKLEDLVVQVAIVRPGPIIGGAVTPYVEHRKRQRTSFLPVEPFYDHPSLVPVLAETHGVILYQEQVLQVSMALSGFSAGEAEGLRRAMTRKRSQEAMAAMWERFRDGALRNNVPLSVAETVFEKLRGFASYGFPKAHAAAFAVLAYQSCWLKRYHPAEFACALLNNQPMGFYPPHALINDGKRHGLRILAPDINASGVRCSVEGGNAIRIGLGYVAALGADVARRIVLEREERGAYQSLADLVRRVAIPITAAENLVAVGAVDRFGLGRREALWQLGLFISARKFGQNRAEQGRQLPLPLPVRQDTVELRPMGAWDQMEADYAILGLSPRYHPLGLLRARLPAHYATIADLQHLPDGVSVEVAGLVVCRQRPGTAKGIQFLLLEDERGLVNIVVYPALYEQRRLIVRGEPFLLIRGTLQKRDDTINVVATDIAPLDAARHATDLPHLVAPIARDLIDPATPQELRTINPATHSYR